MIQEAKPRFVDPVPKNLTPLGEVREEVVIDAGLFNGLHDEIIPAGFLFARAPVPYKNEALESGLGCLPKGGLVFPALI
jgi:hypothetical protein